MQRHFTFSAGTQGSWRIERTVTVRGEPLAPASHLQVHAGLLESTAGNLWSLRGAISNERYVTQPERSALVERQAGLGRTEAVCAVLIPIRKMNAWWSLAQDERRKILEEDSRHIAIGMEYLPAIARRLHHCRDLSPDEPFDFLTWFDFAPSDESAFDDLLARLRATHEWDYVEREVEVRMVLAETPALGRMRAGAVTD